MHITCIRCNQALPIGATFCDACGQPVDADHDRLPDALGRMIEQKARAIVAEERRAEADAAEAERHGRALSELTAMVSAAEAALEGNLRLPRCS